MAAALQAISLLAVVICPSFSQLFPGLHGYDAAQGSDSLTERCGSNLVTMDAATNPYQVYSSWCANYMQVATCIDANRLSHQTADFDIYLNKVFDSEGMKYEAQKLCKQVPVFTGDLSCLTNANVRRSLNQCPVIFNGGIKTIGQSIGKPGIPDSMIKTQYCQYTKMNAECVKNAAKIDCPEGLSDFVADFYEVFLDDDSCVLSTGPGGDTGFDSNAGPGTGGDQYGAPSVVSNCNLQTQHTASMDRTVDPRCVNVEAFYKCVKTELPKSNKTEDIIHKLGSDIDREERHMMMFCEKFPAYAEKIISECQPKVEKELAMCYKTDQEGKASIQEIIHGGNYSQQSLKKRICTLNSDFVRCQLTALSNCPDDQFEVMSYSTCAPMTEDCSAEHSDLGCPLSLGTVTKPTWALLWITLSLLLALFGHS